MISGMNAKAEVPTPADFERLRELHDQASNAVELLKAMANEWRLMVLCQLAEGEKTVSELQATLGLSQSALSQHLAVLRRERIVKARKHAQSVSYSLTGHEAVQVMSALQEIFCAPDAAQRGAQDDS